MTKKLEETFNLAPQVKEEPTNSVIEPETAIEQSTELTAMLNSAIETTDKIDAALPMVQDLNQHDREMDASRLRDARTKNRMTSRNEEFENLFKKDLNRLFG